MLGELKEKQIANRRSAFLSFILLSSNHQDTMTSSSVEEANA